MKGISIKTNSFSKQYIKILPLCLALLFANCQQSTIPSNIVGKPKDVHSYANSDEVIIKHLSLHLKADFAQKVLSGYARLLVEQLSPATELVLDTRDLDIKEILLNDSEKVRFRLDAEDKILGQALHIPIHHNTTSVRIVYSTRPESAAIQWLLPAQTYGKSSPFLFTQSQAILARSWIPCQDSPGIRFTYDAEIAVPPHLMALMSAENDTVLHPDGLYHFQMPQAIPSYLMALTIGDIKFERLGKNCGVYAEPGMLPKSVFEFTGLQTMIDTAEAIYGPYRWGRYDVVVLPPSFPFGGMENPRLTFATPTIIAGDRSLVSLVAHELAHSWSGNLVTNTTWNDFWLNEGFTVYFENRIMEAIYGKPFALMHEALGFGELKRTLEEMGPDNKETCLKLDMKDKDPDDAVTDIAYEKGRFFLCTIEHTVGRQRWDAFLNKYFATHAFGSISTEEFLSYLDKNLLDGHKDWQQKINYKSWIYEPGLPENRYIVNSPEFDQTAAVARQFAAGTPAPQLQTKNWSTFQWMHFLRSLPQQLSPAQMQNLDHTFHFTQSGNSEILCDWLQHCIRLHYEPAYPALKNFLITVGRRKFIKPLYTLMMQDEKLKPMANEIYREARPGYHTVATHTIDEIVD